MHVSAAFVLAAILKCWLNPLPPPFAEDGRGSSVILIARGKSIGLAEGIQILLLVEAVDSNRSRPCSCMIVAVLSMSLLPMSLHNTPMLALPLVCVFSLQLHE